MKRTNQPGKGSTIWIEPIRDLEDIRKIIDHLADRPRDCAIFTLGINTSIRVRALLHIKVGQVRHLRPGDILEVDDQKSGGSRNIRINQMAYDAIQKLLQEMAGAGDHDFLFQSQKGKGALCISYLNRLIKSWCRAQNISGNFGCQTLRKTFGYINFTFHHMDVKELQERFGNLSRNQTLAYLGLTGERRDRNISPTNRQPVSLQYPHL